MKTAKKNFNVDDCVKSVETSAQAVNLVGQLRDLLSRVWFRLLKWFSNRPEVMETIPKSERASLNLRPRPRQEKTSWAWMMEHAEGYVHFQCRPEE